MTALRTFLVPALLLVVALAGCTDGEPPPFERTCPQHAQGLGTTKVHNNFPPSPEFTSTHKQDILGQGFLSFQDHPLDIIEMDFHWEDVRDEQERRGVEVADGRLALHIQDARGRPLAFDDPSTREGPVTSMTFEAGARTNFTLHVPLTGKGADPDPRTITVMWDFVRDLDGNPETADYAVIAYKAVYWYRTC